MKRIGDGVRALALGAADSYRRAWLTLRSVPLLVALVMVPEAAQHLVELRLGMFVSTAAFAQHAHDRVRMAFGYPKLAGLVLVMFGTARFWALGSLRRAATPGASTLLRLLGALALMLVPTVALLRLGQGHGHALGVSTQVVAAAIQLFIGPYVVAALTEERLTVRSSLLDRWPNAIAIALFAALVDVPLQALHSADHKLAIGQPPAVVCAILLFDVIVVGVTAAGMGSALYVGARCSFRGRPGPMAPAA